MKKSQCQLLGGDRIKALFGSHSPILPLPFPRAPSSTLFLVRKFMLRLQGARNEKLLFGVVFAVNSPPWGEQLGEREQLCLVRGRAKVKGNSRLLEPNLL